MDARSGSEWGIERSLGGDFNLPQRLGRRLCGRQNDYIREISSDFSRSRQRSVSSGICCGAAETAFRLRSVAEIAESIETGLIPESNQGS